MAISVIGASNRFIVESSVKTAAASHSLATLADVKSELNIATTDHTNDTLLNRYIAEASKAIENFCNRTFVSETMIDNFFPRREMYYPTAMDGVDPIQLVRWPIISITSVSENDTALVAGTDYFADKAHGQLVRLDVNSYPRMWPTLIIVVEYVAGYATIPSDVSAAAIRTVAQRYFARARDPMLRSEEVPGVWRADYWVQTGSEKTQDGNLSPDVTALLDNYRVPVVA